MSARIYESFKEKGIKLLKEKFSLKNDMAVGKLEKIVISTGLGKVFTDNAKCAEFLEAVSCVAGQKAVFKKAKKSVAAFKVREGMDTGIKVTLRKAKMFEFLDRLRNMALPRMREFEGFKVSSINDRCFSFGLKDITIFPEVKELFKNIDHFGMNINFIFSTNEPKMISEILRFLGFPFKGDKWGIYG